MQCVQDGLSGLEIRLALLVGPLSFQFRQHQFLHAVGFACRHRLRACQRKQQPAQETNLVQQPIMVQRFVTAVAQGSRCASPPHCRRGLKFKNQARQNVGAAAAKQVAAVLKLADVAKDRRYMFPGIKLALRLRLQGWVGTFQRGGACEHQ